MKRFENKEDDSASRATGTRGDTPVPRTQVDREKAEKARSGGVTSRLFTFRKWWRWSNWSRPCLHFFFCFLTWIILLFLSLFLSRSLGKINNQLWLKFEIIPHIDFDCAFNSLFLSVRSEFNVLKKRFSTISPFRSQIAGLWWFVTESLDYNQARAWIDCSFDDEITCYKKPMISFQQKKEVLTCFSISPSQHLSHPDSLLFHIGRSS